MTISSEPALPHTYHKIIDVCNNADPGALRDPKAPSESSVIHCVLGGFLVEQILLYTNPFENR